MKLYYAPLSTYSQKTLIAFNEKNIKCDLIKIDLLNSSEKKRYRDEIYPLGKVPILILDNGHKIPESSIIIDFIDSNFSKGTRLIPENSQSAREARMHDRMADLYLNNPCVSLWSEGQKPIEEQNIDLIEKSKFFIDTTYKYLEKHLISNDWMLGKDFSLADCSTFPALFYLNEIRPFKDRTAINSYFGRLRERPSIHKVICEVAPLLSDMKL